MITNDHNVPLALAVWAVNDDYDHINSKGYISATSLMKPIRSIVLTPRVPFEMKSVEDVIDYVARSLGNSIHAGVEDAWGRKYAVNLKKLGYKEEVINAVRINPEVEEPGTLPVYIEQRGTKEVEINGETFTVGGKFDLCIEGILHDTKTTSTYKWTKGDEQDYIIQGSLYRWIHPDKVKASIIRICFVFTDWQKMLARNNPDYPQQRVMYKDIPLMSIQDTEAWVRRRLSLIQQFRGVPEREVPPCTPEELWIDPPIYKYYSDPNKTDGRATKNFDDEVEAHAFANSKGKGIVIPVLGSPKRCGYCSAFPICTQRAQYQ